MCGVKKATFLAAAVFFVQVFLAQNTYAATTTIQVRVQEVRYVTVDTNGTIVKIESNTPYNVTPITVSENNTKIALTSSVYAQYRSLLAKIDKTKTGIMYDRSKAVATENNQPTLISQIWLFALLKALSL